MPAPSPTLTQEAPGLWRSGSASGPSHIDTVGFKGSQGEGVSSLWPFLIVLSWWGVCFPHFPFFFLCLSR